MFSSNNKEMNRVRKAKKLPKDALAKLNVGVASVLLGTGLVFAGATTANAATVTSPAPADAQVASAASTSTADSAAVQSAQQNVSTASHALNSANANVSAAQSDYDAAARVNSGASAIASDEQAVSDAQSSLTDAVNANHAAINARNSASTAFSNASTAVSEAGVTFAGVAQRQSQSTSLSAVVASQSAEVTSLQSVVSSTLASENAASYYTSLNDNNSAAPATNASTALKDAYADWQGANATHAALTAAYAAAQKQHRAALTNYGTVLAQYNFNNRDVTALANSAREGQTLLNNLSRTRTNLANAQDAVDSTSLNRQLASSAVDAAWHTLNTDRLTYGILNGAQLNSLADSAAASNAAVTASNAVRANPNYANYESAASEVAHDSTAVSNATREASEASANLSS